MKKSSAVLWRMKYLRVIIIVAVVSVLLTIIALGHNNYYKSQIYSESIFIPNNPNKRFASEEVEKPTIPDEALLVEGTRHPLRNTSIEPLDGVWQKVVGTKHRFEVYSAFLEWRGTPAIRIIGITHTHHPVLVYCRIWLPGDRSITVKAHVQAVREHWDLKYSAVYVLCFLDDDVNFNDLIGAAVAVMTRKNLNMAPDNLLTIIDTRPKPGIDDVIHVCAKSLHNNFHSNWLVEWFEFNRLLGVTQFYMYNKSMSGATECVLQHYHKKGLITMRTWNFDGLISEVDIRIEGQFATFSDCLYRSMSSAGWLAVLDIDELLVPTRERTVVELLNSLLESVPKRSKEPAGFIFRNAFFYTFWENDVRAPVPLLTAVKTRRVQTPLPEFQRSKYAIRPQHTVELGNHFVWEHSPNYESRIVPIHRGLTHHYREDCEGGDAIICLTVDTVVDRIAHKWSKELMSRVVTETEELHQSCPNLYWA